MTHFIKTNSNVKNLGFEGHTCPLKTPMAQPTISEPNVNVTFQLLASQPRRLILQYCIESTNPASIDDLADYIRNHVATHRAARQSILTELHHNHLPKLEAHGLINYDQRTGAIRYHSNDRIENILECLSGD